MARHGCLCRTDHSLARPPRVTQWRCVVLAAWWSLAASGQLTADPPRPAGPPILGGIVASDEEPTDSRPSGVASDERSGGATAALEEPILSVDLSGEGLFYSPGETLRAVIRRSGAAGDEAEPLEFLCQLRRLHDRRTIVERRLPADGDLVDGQHQLTAEITLPSEPGVYEWSCRLQRAADRLWSPWRRPADVTAAVQRPVIVVPDAQRGSETAATWETVSLVRASQPRPWSLIRWLPTRPGELIPGYRPPPLARLQRREHMGESVAEIGPGETLEAPLPRSDVGLPHRVTLRYPAGAKMKLRAELVDARSGEATGRRFLLREQPHPDPEVAWRQFTFVTYPSRKGERLRLTNLDETRPASLESITVEAGPRGLADPRDSGFEEGTPARRRTVAMSVSDPGWIESLTGDLIRDGVFNGLQTGVAETYRAFVASERLADYALAHGMNAVVLPIDRFAAAWAAGTPRGATGEEASNSDGVELEVALRVLALHGVQVIASVDLDFPLPAVDSWLDQHSSDAAEVLRPAAGADAPARYNPLHPEISRRLGEMVAVIDARLQAAGGVAAIELRAGPASHLRVSSTAPETAPAIRRQFALTLDAADMPISQRQAWAAQEGRESFERWIDERRMELVRELCSAVPNRRLILSADFGWPGDPASDEGSVAIDPIASSLQVHPTVELMQHGTDELSSHLRQERRAEEWLETPEPELPRRVLRCGVAAPGEVPGMIGEPLLVNLTRGIDRFDPPVVIVDLSLQASQLSAQLRRLSRRYGSLPASPSRRVDPHDPADRTVRLRAMQDSHRSWYLLANTAPWRAEVELLFAEATELEQDDADPTTDLSLLEVSEDAKRIRLGIPAGGLLTLRTVAPAELTGWSAKPSGGTETLAAIHRQVTWVFERLGTLTSFREHPGLSNGGFELPGDVGLAGWLHAQHPPQAVTIDENEAIEGKRSICLTNDAHVSSRTWLVSEAFPTPTSGRIAVSIACRAAPSDDVSPLKLRVAVEGTDQEGPVRHATVLALPRDGKWHENRVVLEVDGLDVGRVERLRLAIDHLSSGRVWLDDIRLHDRFPTATELTQLRSHAFLAVQGLRRANLTAASRLLQNFWAGTLLAEMPAIEEMMTEASGGDDASSSPGVTARLRDWLPQSLRF